jgi:F0F1-type ATP synthase membrane subunit a
VLVGLTTAVGTAAVIFISFAVGLGLFVGAIQAFIFTVLTVAYIGIATSSEEAH